MQKVYIAGPTVFHVDAKEKGEQMKDICKQHGLVGFFPMDNEVIARTKGEMALQIYGGNLQLMQEADIVVACLDSFRGAEPDSGTCFEVGYATALGKKVYGYVSDNRPLIHKQSSTDVDGIYYDTEGHVVEDFDFPVNLMLGMACKVVVGGFEDCILQVEKDMKKGA